MSLVATFLRLWFLCFVVVAVGGGALVAFARFLASAPLWACLLAIAALIALAPTIALWIVFRGERP